MCGIAGIYNFKTEAQSKDIQKMTNVLRHRGPDDEGFLAAHSELGDTYPLIGEESKVQGPRIDNFSKPVNLLLGHRRLAVLDLSPAGHQPMCNEDGSIWIVYNGEIYNYLEIRIELMSAKHRFKSQTDTEVIIHAYEEWGTECLKRFNGMWALAIFDLRSNRIFCSRDRAGVKPFYYFYDGKRFCFASEIKAFFEMDQFSIEPNEQIIADYLFSGLLDHTNETFFKNIYQLRPGEYLLFEGNQLSVQVYWDIESNEVHLPRVSDYAEQFRSLLRDSIRLRLRSDVPIGSCLSGGLDSSSIVCVANRLMFDGKNIDPHLVGERQKTFSSCFEDPSYDERKFIERVINQTGAEKNYVFPKGETLFEDLPKLIWHQDEPFGSTSIYAQWSVMGLSKKRGVTVLLDGQGGDELLAGYLPSFRFMMKEVLKQLDLIRFIKEAIGFRRNLGNNLKPYIPGMIISAVPNPAKRLIKKVMGRGTAWANGDFEKKYFRHFPMPKKFKKDLNNYLYQVYRYSVLPSLLHYEDRNSMAFSLETRLPFLDYRLVEYTFTLPLDQKIKEGVTKVVLRNAMENILPEEIRNRKDKMGFVTPEGIWVRTDLRTPLREIISSKSFRDRGFFNVAKIKEIFDNHCNGKVKNSAMIWRWVNLELWFRIFVDQKPWLENWKNLRNL